MYRSINHPVSQSINPIMSEDKSTQWPYLLPRERGGKKTFVWNSFVWRSGSFLVVPSVAACAKMWLNWFNRSYIQHHEVFIKTVDEHYKKRSQCLITISNHHSCLDDPGLWGALFPWRWIFNSHRHRWSAAAHDVCFTKPIHSLFFSLGKTFPVIRGKGIHQLALDYALDLMKRNQFLHVFPQGRVVDDYHDHGLVFGSKDGKFDSRDEKFGSRDEKFDSRDERVRRAKQLSLRDGDFQKEYELKWGLAHLIIEYLSSTPAGTDLLILPFYHLGMQNVLPNDKPYVPRRGNKVFISVREEGPIIFNRDFLRQVCYENRHDLTVEQKRHMIMSFIELEMKLVKLKALEFRAKFV